MKAEELEIKGVFMFTPEKHGDTRGWFRETWREDVFSSVCPGVRFVQENESESIKDVLRGLHWQIGRHAQAKLVCTSRGRVLDVAVDLRQDSPSYGRYVSVILDAEEGNRMFIPRGFAHGFRVISETARFRYLVDNAYCPEAEAGIAWDDPDIGIDWGGNTENVILSGKDSKRPRLKDIGNPDAGCSRRPDDDSLRDEVVSYMTQFTGENFIKAPWAIDSTGMAMPINLAQFGASWQKEKDRGAFLLLRQWFSDIADDCSHITSGNVAHKGTAIRGLARNCAEYIDMDLL